MTTFGDQVFEMGGSPVGPLLMGQAGGNRFYVNAASGSDDNDGLTPSTAKSTLLAGYNLCTDNNNDIVFLIGDSSGLNLSAALEWAKSYTHLIGVCAPTRVGKRARIFQLSTLTGASPLLTISGSGCVFKDFYIFQGVDDATSLINVSVTGERNFFDNIHFAGGGNATQAVDGGASLQLNGGSENTFVNCVIGVDTIAAGTGMMGIHFDGQASRNIFENCYITMYAGNTGATFVEVADGTGIDRYTVFDNCNFINSNSDNYLMASAFVIPEFAANNSSRILLKDCMIHGTTKLDASDRGVLYGNMNDITGADTSGLAVELIS